MNATSTVDVEADLEIIGKCDADVAAKKCSIKCKLVKPSHLGPVKSKFRLMLGALSPSYLPIQACPTVSE